MFLHVGGVLPSGILSAYGKLPLEKNTKFHQHPNYVGEITLWAGIAIISCSSLVGWQYISLISPVFTYILLVYISGVPQLKESGQKKWGYLDSYKEYLKNTPTLV